MRRKIFDKAREFPGSVDVSRTQSMRTLREFDDLYTAPMHGYLNALDYWTRAASLPLLWWLDEHAAVASWLSPLQGSPRLVVLLLGFALSFSSTVFAVKVLEDRSDMNALYAKLAIGVLIMQDIFAVGFLTASTGKLPSIWAISWWPKPS
mgnify:CR=1 FL=1